jgi:hypothetical protein
MSSISSTSSFNFDSEWRVDLKSRLLGINDQVVLRKVAFGFFGNNEPAYNFKNVEWCAGSLSAKCIKKLLVEFIHSSEAQQLLQNETLEQLKKYSALLEANRSQAALVDDIRSSNLQLSLLAATGYELFSQNADCNIDPREIEELTTLTLKQIEDLKISEKILFLSGNLLHETQLSIERKEESLYEICHYDSNTGISVYEADKTALTEEFFRKVCARKFMHHVLTAQDIIEDEARDPKFIKITPSKLDAAQPSRQTSNTCHARGLLAVLKDTLVRHSPLREYQALKEWKLFKQLFAGLIAQKIEDAPLRAICERRSIKYSQDSGMLDHFNFCIENGMFGETVEVYIKALSRFNRKINKASIDKFSELQALKFLHNTLLATIFGTVEVNPKLLVELKSFLKDFDGNACLNKSIELLLRKYAANMEKFRCSIRDEIDCIHGNIELKFRDLDSLAISSSKLLDVIIEKLIDIADKMDISVSKFSISSGMSKSGEPIALTEEELDEYLSILAMKPEQIYNLNKLASVREVLIQGVKQGKWEIIEKISKELGRADQKILEGFISHSYQSEFAQYPPFADEWFINRPDSLIAKVLSQKYMDVLFSTKQFAKLIQLSNVVPYEMKNPCLVYHFNNDEELLPVEQIVETINVITQLGRGKIEDSILIEISKSIAYSLVGNNELDIYKKCAQLPLTDLSEAYYWDKYEFNLTSEELQMWLTTIYNFPLHPLENLVKNIVFRCLYRQDPGILLQLLEQEEKISLQGINRPYFQFTFSKDNVSAGVSWAKKTNHRALRERLYTDLLRSCELYHLKGVAEELYAFKKHLFMSVVKSLNADGGSDFFGSLNLSIEDGEKS